MKNIKGKSQTDFGLEVGDKFFPSLYVDETEIPEIDSWKVGNEYLLNIKVKMTNKDEYANGRHTSARLEVLSYEDLTAYDDDPSTPRVTGGLPDKI